MMAEIRKIWGEDEQQLLRRGHCQFVYGTGWGPTRNYYRVFYHDDCEKPMGRSRARRVTPTT